MKVEGWPVELVRFQNLSEVSSPYDALKTLLDNWSSGKTHWRVLSEDELEELVQEREEQVANGELQEPARRRPRSDRGKKRKVFSRRHSDNDGESDEDDGEFDDDDDGSEIDGPVRRKHVKRAKKSRARMGKKIARTSESLNPADDDADADNADYDN